MSIAEPAPLPGEGRLKGTHVLFIMLAFFSVIFAVNGVFLYYALTTHPGEQVEKSYLQGLSFNDTLERRAEQAALGWHASAGIVPHTSGADQFLVEYVDDNDVPLQALDVVTVLSQPGSDTNAFTLEMTHLGEGRYASPSLSLCKGNWNASVIALTPDGTPFELVKPLILTGASADGGEIVATCPTPLH